MNAEQISSLKINNKKEEKSDIIKGPRQSLCRKPKYERLSKHIHGRIVQRKEGFFLTRYFLFCFAVVIIVIYGLLYFFVANQKLKMMLLIKG